MVDTVAELAGIVGPCKRVAEPAAFHAIGEVNAVLADPPRYKGGALPAVEPPPVGGVLYRISKGVVIPLYCLLTRRFAHSCLTVASM
jgi:hypothetical protein